LLNVRPVLSHQSRKWTREAIFPERVYFGSARGQKAPEDGFPKFTTCAQCTDIAMFLGAVRFVFTTLGQEKLVRSVVRVDTEDLPCQSRTTVASWAASPSGLSLDIRAQASSVDLATWCCPHGSTTRGYSGGGHHRRRRDDDRPASRVRVQPQPSRAADTLKKRISGSLT